LYECKSWFLTLREEHRLRVFENRVLTRMFGPETHELTGGWRELHNEELYNLYSSPDIIRVIKSRKMAWVAHVAGMRRKMRTFLLERLKARDNSENLGVDGRIILKWILRK
jgi:hypothetical protein